MGSGFVVEKNDESSKLKICYYAMDYKDRVVRKREFCSFDGEVPDRPLFFKRDVIMNYSEKEFRDDFSYDKLSKRVNYMNPGSRGLVEMKFGNGLQAVRMFNDFAESAVPYGFGGNFTLGDSVDNDLFEVLRDRDIEIATAKDCYAEDLMFAVKELAGEARKLIVKYSELLRDERNARKKYAKFCTQFDKKFIKTSSMKKEKDKLFKDIGMKTSARKSAGIAFSALMPKIKEAYFAFDMLSKSNSKLYSEAMLKMSTDFKNLIKLDIIRRRALGKDVPGGPKLMVASNVSTLFNKYCRRLESNSGFIVKNYLGYNSKYLQARIKDSTSKKIVDEKRRRFGNIFDIVKFGSVDNTYPAPLFYKAQYCYYLKLFNENKLKTFDDSTVVLRMMAAQYPDNEIIKTIENLSPEAVGKPRSEIVSLISNCRIRYNEMRTAKPKVKAKESKVNELSLKQRE